MTGLLHRQNGEKQISCMSGIFHIFDRQHILARKRIHSAKRLGVSDSPETVSSGESHEFCQELVKLEPEENLLVTSPATPTPSLSKSSSGKWRPGGDGEAEADECRPPGVVARLMGLEPLSSSRNQNAQESANATPALPRSNSECRRASDPVHSKYIDGNNFQVKQPNRSYNHRDNLYDGACKPTESANLNTRMHEELDKRLKMRGMDEQFNDLTALKQILEVLQLKGLQYSRNCSNRNSQRNFVYDRNSGSNESSIHLQQWRSLASKFDQHRRLKRDHGTVNRIESNLKSCNSINKKKPLCIDIQTSSPKLAQKIYASDFISKVVTEDESSYVSERIVKSTSATNLEGWEHAGCRGSKQLLERCDKLLHNIAEMNSATESPPSSAAVLPSPVSVLDSGFDKDESSSPSDSIDFKASPAVDFEDDNWTTKISPTEHQEHQEHEELISHDSDFIYISEILQTSQHLQGKKMHKTENTLDDSKVSKCHKKLVFDVINEMLDRKRQFPPWKISIGDSQTSTKQIWNEFLKIREVVIKTGDDIDVLELITCVLKKEVGTKDWDDYPIETSEVVLDVERLIFKDLVSEAIGDLVVFSGECVFSRTRRKLVF